MAKLFGVINGRAQHVISAPFIHSPAVRQTISHTAPHDQRTTFRRIDARSGGGGDADRFFGATTTRTRAPHEF
jgi:hypothetical protein